jgi:hypothetical protein
MGSDSRAAQLGRSIRRLAELARANPETALGLLILLLAVTGAYVTWQAANASGNASGLQQQARQATVLSDYYRDQIRTVVSYEERLAESFRSHVTLADGLDGDARRIRTADPSRAAELTDRAQEERAVARSFQVLFDRGYPTPGYETDKFLRIAIAADTQLQDLQPKPLTASADRARERRTWLGAVDIAVIAAIFFLTLAQLVPSMRAWFARVGIAFGAVALVLLPVVLFAITAPD